MMKYSKFFRSLIAMILVFASVLSLAAGAFAQESEDAVYTEEFISQEEAEEIVDESDYVLDFNSDSENSYDLSQILENAGLDPHSEEKPATRAGTGDNWNKYLYLDFRPLSPERDYGWMLNTHVTEGVTWASSYIGQMTGKISGQNAYFQMPKNKFNFKIPDGSKIRIRVNMSTNETLGIVATSALAEGKKHGTVASAVRMFFSDGTNSYATGTIVLKTDYQYIDYTIPASSIGKTLTRLELHIFEAKDSAGNNIEYNTAMSATCYATVNVDFIYIGPSSLEPKYVKYDCDGDLTNTSERTEHVPVGAGGTFNYHTKTNSATTIWGWKEYINGTYTGNFYMDPAEATVTKANTEFRVASLTMPNATTSSNKSLGTGDDKDDDNFTLTLDAVNTAKITQAKYARPQDITIILDRSGSMAHHAYATDTEAEAAGELWNVNRGLSEESAKSRLDSIYKELDNTKPYGYYRATMYVKHEDGQFWSNHGYSLPIMYRNGKWWMCVQTGKVSGEKCTGECGGNLRTNGLYLVNDIQPCTKCRVWYELYQAYAIFEERRTGNTSDTNRNKVNFQIFVPRITKAVEAISDFVDELYASTGDLAPNQFHSVSILSFGAGLYVPSGPYSYSNGKNAAGTERLPVNQTTKWNYDKCSVKVTQLDEKGYSSIMSSLRSTFVHGSTRADTAFIAIGSATALNDIEKATTNKRAAAQADYLAAKNSARDRTVVFLTDGCPTEITKDILITSNQYSHYTAGQCINQAKTLKNSTNQVKIYSIGFFDGLNPSKYFDSSVNKYAASGASPYQDTAYDTTKANNFLHLVSSNYPNASATVPASGTLTKTSRVTYSAGTRSSNAYYMADTGSGAALGEHFSKILTSVAPDFEVVKDQTLYIYDEITREFQLDEDRTIKIYAQAHTTNGTFSNTKVLLAEHTVSLAPGETRTFTEAAYELTCARDAHGELTKVTLKWTDCKKAYLRNTEIQTNSAVPDTLRGYKILMEIPIVVNRDNTLGGNQIPTNTAASGLYYGNADDTGIGTSASNYTVPKANVSPRYEFQIHDYFMELPTMATIYKNGLNTSGEIFEAMTSSNVTLVNGNSKSRLDYLNLDIVVKTTDGEEVYRNSASAGAKEFEEKVSALESEFDFTTDQPMEVFYTVSHKYSGTDSVDREQYNTVNSDPLIANYYAPKFMVVDFDAVGSVSLQREVDAERLSFSATNGGYDSQTGMVKFDFRETFGSKDERKMMEGWVTIPYTFDSINVPKDGVDIRSRQVYILPGNVISYDDTLFGFWEDGALDTTATVPTAGKWVRMGTYDNDQQLPENSQVHGYDEKFATTGDYHGASTVARVSAQTPDVPPIVFEFFGTGFELLSRTAPDSGAVVVEIFKVKGDGSYGDVADKGYLVDTYLANNTLYQIPIVQFLSGETTPAKYKVHVIPVYDMIFDHGKKGFTPITEEQARAIAGFDETVDFTFVPSSSVAPATRGTYEPAGAYNVYVDGCRVYNTLTEDTQGIRDYIYSLAGEQDANILNINDQIVDATTEVDWTNNQKVTGMLFIEAPKADASDPEGDTGSDDTITNTTHGYCLGMNGSLFEEADPDDSNKFYVRHYETVDGVRTLVRTMHGEYNTDIYYRLSPKKRTMFYCTDNTGAEVPLTEAEVREYVGNGEEIVYYSSAYKAIGPANEVYLSSGQGVAFKVNANSAKVFMSMKTVYGTAVTVQAYNGTTFETISGPTGYCSDTEMYFDLTGYVNDGMVMIKNAGSGMLSLCNLKTASAEERLLPIIDAPMVHMALQVFSKEAELPAVDENVQIRHSLNLQSDISVNLMVPAAVLEGYDRYVMECTVAGKTFYPEAQVRDGVVYFVVDGIMATQMNENIHSVLHLIKGDEEILSPADDYSVACYAYSTLNKDEASDSIKTLCANLLRYGSLAQIFKGYQTDALADEEMTEIHKSYLTDMDTVAFGSNNRLLGDVTDPTVTWFGKSMILDSKVTMVYVLNVNGYAGAPEDLRLRVSYEDINGRTVELELDDIRVYNEEAGLYCFDLDALLAAELRTVVAAAVYAEGVQVSETLCYSADTYGNGKTGMLAELCKALFAYSDSARAFFAG